jgi:SsrA-binding protein
VANKKDAAREAAARSPVLHNRKALHKFEVIESFECGIVLAGPEVKSLREGRAHLDESYARLRGGELFLLQMHVEEYRHKGMAKHEPTRPRKLLLHKMELRRLADRVTRENLTLVPLRLHWNERGIAKIDLALVRGKKLHDKRETEKRKTARREMQRMVRRR